MTKFYNKEELITKSKEDLIKIIMSNNTVIGKLTSLNNSKSGLLRNYKLRLKKIRNSLDYLLDHPYSTGVGYQSNKHDRESNGNKSKRT